MNNKGQSFSSAAKGAVKNKLAKEKENLKIFMVREILHTRSINSVQDNIKMEVAPPTCVREMINLKTENFCVIFSVRTECLPLE